jgi:hypothetical protein
VRRANWGVLGVDGRITLKLKLKELVLRVLSGSGCWLLAGYVIEWWNICSLSAVNVLISRGAVILSHSIVVL